MASKEPRDDRCGGKLKGGGFCERWPARGKRRCKRHGAHLEVLGPAHPKYTNGNSSRWVPPRYLDAYERVMDDEELLSMKAHFALLQGRLEEILGRIGTTESNVAWQRGSEVISEIREANRTRNTQAFADGMVELEGIFVSGELEANSWDEARAIIRDQAKIVDSERRRSATLAEFVPVVQMIAITGKIINLAAGAIDDQNALRRFRGEVQQIFPQKAPA